MSRIDSLRGVVLATVILCAWCVRPLSAQPAGPRLFAVLVGVEEYEHSSLREPPLKYACDDAASMGEVLRAGGYQVTLLTDEAGAQSPELMPIKVNIEARLKDVLRQCKAQDTVIVGLAGHGLQFAGEKDAYFCPRDARPFVDEAATLVSLSHVYSELEKSFAGVRIILVDACRNDPNPSRGRGLDADTAPPPPRGVATLFSCSAGQRAFEHDQLKHGVFFHHVLEGLRGKAADEEGEVTFDLLSAYVRRNVPRDVARLMENQRQFPNLKADLVGVPPVLVKVERKIEPVQPKPNPVTTPPLTPPPAMHPMDIVKKASPPPAPWKPPVRLASVANEDWYAKVERGEFLGMLLPGEFPRDGVAKAAKEFYDRGFARETPFFGSDLELGALLYETNKAGAISDYSEAIRLEPTFADAYRRRAAAYVSDGNRSLAIDDYTKLIELEPGIFDNYYRRAEQYLEKEEFSLALADLTTILDGGDSTPDVFLKRAALYEKQEKNELAIEDATRVLSSHPNHVAALYLRARLSSDYELNIEDCTRLIAESGTESEVTDAYYWRGLAYYLLDRLDLAVDDFTTLISRNESFADGYLFRGYVYSALKQYDKAIADFTSVLKHDEQNMSAIVHRADSYLEKKNYDLAIRDCTTAIGWDATSIEPLLKRAEVHEARKTFTSAAADLRAAVKLDPESLEANNSLAWLLATCPDSRARNGRDAITYAVKACELTEYKDAMYVDTLAAACAEANDFPKAIGWQAEAVRLAGDADKADYQTRHALYVARKPYRHTPAPAKPIAPPQ